MQRSVQTFYQLHSPSLESTCNSLSLECGVSKMASTDTPPPAAKAPVQIQISIFFIFLHGVGFIYLGLQLWWLKRNMQASSYPALFPSFIQIAFLVLMWTQIHSSLEWKRAELLGCPLHTLTCLVCLGMEAWPGCVKFACFFKGKGMPAFSFVPPAFSLCWEGLFLLVCLFDSVNVFCLFCFVAGHGCHLFCFVWLRICLWRGSVLPRRLFCFLFRGMYISLSTIQFSHWEMDSLWCLWHFLRFPNVFPKNPNSFVFWGGGFRLLLNKAAVFFYKENTPEFET